ncbi:M48 family metalloprotease [Salinispira pacifica]
MSMKHRTLPGARHLVFRAALAAVVVTAFLAGCSTLTDLGTQVGVQQGVLSDEQAASINTTAKNVEKSFQDITPEQEYYIGRAVGAVILSRYKTYDNQKANEYLNLLGQSLALVSTRPVLYSGYRFQILDSNDVNALSTPSGLVFVTRGLLRLAKSEAEVAAILAHEIGHIEDKHALKAIKTSRITTALTGAALTGAQMASNQDVAQLTDAFSGSINDITQTLVNTGYSRSAETEADEAAVQILERAGYDPRALVSVLQSMKANVPQNSGVSFTRTHPLPADRITDVQKTIGNYRAPGYDSAVTQKRFQAALAGI